MRATNRLLVSVCFVVYVIITAILALWPHAFTANPCTGNCDSLPEQTVTTVTERGIPFVWSRTFKISDMTSPDQVHTITDYQKMVLNIVVLATPLLLLGVLMKVSQQYADTRD